jgi:hypothetical protein
VKGIRDAMMPGKEKGVLGPVAHAVSKRHAFRAKALSRGAVSLS